MKDKMNNENIFDNDCFAYHKLLLKLLGFSTNQNIFYKIYSIILLAISTIYILATIPEVYNKEKDFIELTDSLFFEIGKLTSLTSAYILYWNRYKLQKLFEAFEILRKILNRTDNNNKILFLQYQKFIRKQSIIGIMVWSVIVFSQILVSVVLSFNKEEWLLPFGSGPNINNNVNFVVQLIIISIIILLTVLQMFTYVNMLTLIVDHCKQLQKCLITTMMIKNEENSTMKARETDIIDWKTFQVTLRIIVPYHIGIIDAANQIENTFSYIILVTFGGAVISFCFQIFHITAINFDYLALIKGFASITMGNFVIFFLSFWGEQVIAESGNISKTCYELDFIGADLRIQKSLLLIMTRAQKPITLTIGRLKILNFNTMLALFKAMYTYYTVLANISNQPAT